MIGVDSDPNFTAWPIDSEQVPSQVKSKRTSSPRPSKRLAFREKSTPTPNFQMMLF